MTKYFADTNIFIRYFLNDDQKFSNYAREIITNCENGKFALIIIPATILEIVWLLNSFYKLPKTETVKKVESLWELKNLHIVDKNLAASAIKIYKNKNVDFVDAFFAANMAILKIKEIFSFDRDFDKIPNLKRLEKV